MNTNDRDVLRKLAGQYFLLAQQDRFIENRKLHRAVNDLKPIRPVVLIDELPWHEMNINNELTLQCQDPVLKDVEWFFRSNLYKAKHLPADMILMPYVPIQKVVHSTGIGISIDEKTMVTDGRNSIRSHEYYDQLATDEDLEKLHDPVIAYDKDKTLKIYQQVGDLVGDILPVRLKGYGYCGSSTWDDIARYRGVTNLLMDLADSPEFMHKTVRKLHDINWNTMRQFEVLGLFDNDPYELHCTPVITSDLPGKDFDGEHVKLKHLWARNAAQIFGSVSKDMHDEFEIQYIIPAVRECGLVYYGCCEPLDKKMDIVEKIPNLRKVSITPWADIHIAAEAIGKRFVVSAKPNPASVAVERLDHHAIKKELSTIIGACARNGCSCDIVLKDISTCCGRPENIFEWERIAMELVKG